MPPPNPTAAIENSARNVPPARTPRTRWTTAVTTAATIPIQWRGVSDAVSTR